MGVIHSVVKREKPPSKRPCIFSRKHMHRALWIIQNNVLLGKNCLRHFHLLRHFVRSFWRNVTSSSVTLPNTSLGCNTCISLGFCRFAKINRRHHLGYCLYHVLIMSAFCGYFAKEAKRTIQHQHNKCSISPQMSWWCHRVLTRILKIGVKMLSSRKRWEFYYVSIETAKSWESETKSWSKILQIWS